MCYAYTMYMYVINTCVEYILCIYMPKIIDPGIHCVYVYSNKINQIYVMYIQCSNKCTSLVTNISNVYTILGQMHNTFVK